MEENKEYKYTVTYLYIDGYNKISDSFIRTLGVYDTFEMAKKQAEIYRDHRINELGEGYETLIINKVKLNESII